jgi:hypothetical protein
VSTLPYSTLSASHSNILHTHAHIAHLPQKNKKTKRLFHPFDTPPTTALFGTGVSFDLRDHASAVTVRNLSEVRAREAMAQDSPLLQRSTSLGSQLPTAVYELSSHREGTNATTLREPSSPKLVPVLQRCNGPQLLQLFTSPALSSYSCLRARVPRATKGRRELSPRVSSYSCYASEHLYEVAPKYRRSSQLGPNKCRACSPFRSSEGQANTLLQHRLRDPEVLHRSLGRKERLAPSQVATFSSSLIQAARAFLPPTEVTPALLANNPFPNKHHCIT